MTIVRSETVTLPQTDEGRFLARHYKEDMENEHMFVTLSNTTTTIVVYGIFTGDIPANYVKRLMEEYALLKLREGQKNENKRRSD